MANSPEYSVLCPPMSRVQHRCLSCEQGEANSRRYMLTKIKGDKSPAGGTKRRASAGAGNHARMDQQTLSEKKRRKWRIRQERHRTENRRAKGRILTRHVDGLEDSQSKAMHDLAAFMVGNKHVLKVCADNRFACRYKSTYFGGHHLVKADCCTPRNYVAVPLRVG